ncbi:hypothetical protein G0Q06_05020 [Puniceicoccales bacterium CK1056]|uniref:Endonuclease I n=1 Tax=Oceanipulchritudo coccoides TaxID=2706888 RepID=A0A6B2M1Y9_9BACT|nr:endonuclease [Oceanipulchritudo coccoides]NDV61805.1 hypothetical protein [Oceanipulchritudo coccoides]
MTFRLSFFRSFLLSVPFLVVCPKGSAQDYGPPEGFYNNAEGQVGTALRNELQNLIDNNQDLGYDAARTALRTLDADPEVEGNILLMYSGDSIPSFLFNTTGGWNREHLWPQSFGADAATKPGADLHHLYPADPGVNSARSNLIFDYTNPGDFNTNPKAPGSSYDSNSWEPRDEDKGRVARAMLYMDLRYDGSDSSDFVLKETANQSTTAFAKLSVLLEWHRLFPADERERRRNHLIYTGFSFGAFNFNQGNRNPFVDIPDLAEVIFTGDDYIGWGTWRWTHFSIDQLVNGLQINDLDDPDEDYRLNLIEYGVNTDPTSPETSEILNVSSFGSFGSQIRYTRQKLRQLAGVDYAVEASSTPLREETWSVLTEDDWTNFFATDQGDTELVTIALPPAAEPTWYRLRVTRETGPDSSISAAYNPVLANNPATADSIFVYQNKLNGSDFKQSPWFGSVADDHYPWVYHLEHNWLYLSATRDDAVWFFDTNLGWSFTSSDVYPYLYSFDLGGWIYFLKSTYFPNRWIYVYGQGWIQEQTLLAQST